MTTALVVLLVALGGLAVRALRRAARVLDAAVTEEVDDPRLIDQTRRDLDGDRHPDPRDTP